MATAKVFKPPYKAHPAQSQFHKDPHRFRVLNCGRRFGKTKCGIHELWKILQQAPERKPIGWVVAPNYPLIMVDWDEALDSMGNFVTSRNVQDHWLEVSLGEGRTAKIEFKSAEKDEQGLLGRGLSGCLLDEAKMISQRAWDYGIRPSLADKRGKAILISSPKGRNFFYDCWLKGQETADTNDKEWKSWSFPSNINPYFPLEEWEALKAVTPEMVWRQEYMAEFLEDTGEVFHSLNRLLKCELSQREHGRQYVIGVDLAKSIDWTVILVMDDLGRIVHAHRSKELSWAVQIRIIEDIYRLFAPARVVLDSSGLGDPIEESVRRTGIPTEGVQTGSNKMKTELIEGLQVAIEQGHVQLPDALQWLWDELRQYTYERLEKSGLLRFTAPPGKHDDGVIALALCVKAMSGKLGKAPIVQPVESEYTTFNEWLKLTDPKRRPTLNRWGRKLNPHIVLKKVWT